MILIYMQLPQKDIERYLIKIKLDFKFSDFI